MVSAKEGWGLARGDVLAEGQTALKLLGGGVLHEAYLAFDDRTLGAVVVKVLRPGEVADEHSLGALRREAEALEAVRHPAVVRLLHAELGGDRPRLVLEHLEGPRLSTLVRKHGPLEPQQYLPLALELAAAVHFLGQVDLVHLDIKPGNVIMGSPAKLIDLSLARSSAAAAALTEPVGTDDYMAPEQCAPGSGTPPSFATDVWGLGATIFEAIAGYGAFPEADDEAEDPEQRYPQLAHEPYALPAAVPPDVAEAVRACLARDPADRPTPREFSEALEDVVGRTPRGRLTLFKIR